MANKNSKEQRNVFDDPRCGDIIDVLCDDGSTERIQIYMAYWAGGTRMFQCRINGENHHIRTYRIDTWREFELEAEVVERSPT